MMTQTLWFIQFQHQLCCREYQCFHKGSATDVAQLYLLPSGDTLADKHYIEEVSLETKNVLERTNIVLEAGAKVGFNASADTVVTVQGIEESV